MVFDPWSWRVEILVSSDASISLDIRKQEVLIAGGGKKEIKKANTVLLGGQSDITCRRERIKKNLR